jgi:hypothetical protein
VRADRAHRSRDVCHLIATGFALFGSPAKSLTKPASQTRKRRVHRIREDSPNGSSAAPVRPKRFYGTVTLDPTRVGRDAGRIADEVIAHLSGLMGSSVKVTLEIETDVSAGVPENVVRTVTENSRTLKFGSHAFENE